MGITTPDYYYYLNQSGTYQVEGVDDNKEFQDTRVSELTEFLDILIPVLIVKKLMIFVIIILSFITVSKNCTLCKFYFDYKHGIKISTH